jgi:hypothetical protein
MKSYKKYLPVALLLSMPTAYAADSLEEAISGGDASLNFRYRYEFVDQEGISKDAGASTLRTRLSYKTLPYNQTSFFIEMDDLSYVGSERFNNTRNGETRYPVVADPEGTHINQAYFKYEGDKAAVTLGRQRINMDGQRFIGGVGWRQNEQTYDAFRVDSKSFENTKVSYVYINRVSRIFGPDDGTPDDVLDSNSHLLNAKFNLSDNTALTAYAYALDFEDADGLSNQTIGVMLSHKIKSGDNVFPITLEYASQDDHGDNPTSYSADYYHITVGASIDKVKLNLGYEVLEGNDSPGEAFRTPLATLHKFNGWTDKFLTTPSGGIEDTYLTLKYGTLTLAYHQFDAETGSGEHGSEWGISWAHKFSNHYSLLLKFADYSAEDHASDTTKGWLMFTATF